MKSIVVVFALLAIVAVKCEDELDMDAVVADHDLLKKFLDCFLDKGPCPGVGESLKEPIRETFRQTCSRCSARVKHMYWTFLEGAKKFYPDRYEQFIHHFDPDNKYFDALLEELAKYSKRF